MKISSKKIRQDFIDFFLDKEHKFVRSSPVFSLDDPTLLFINAGMNQFKDIFLGKEKIKYPRVTNSQKCIRVSGKHNDLEEVGLDKFHHTFFEMLGNWSFADFSKKEIIMWSWELLTDIWKLDKDRLWVTVYKDDDEALNLWKEYTDISPDRVLKFGDKDNFWEMGSIGPCGPCSEIHYYTGDNPSNQQADGVNKLDEYRELWNLVFIEYNRIEDGSLDKLPMTHVDTGMGLERILATLNGLDDHYKTDLFLSIINKIEKISTISYSEDSGMAHRVIADHIRMVSFSLADGIMPSNEGRGYVVRRVLRRAARFGRVLNIEGAFLHNLVEPLCNILGDAYPELIEKKEHIEKVIKIEEISFGKTLDRGLGLINEIIDLQDNKIISGENVFKLYDTYGFPVDLTQLIAREHGFDIDTESFNEFMKKQKTRAREGNKFHATDNKTSWTVLLDNKQSHFIGYEKSSSTSKIIKYRSTEDNFFEIILDETPFYAESGGQIGDIGEISSDDIVLSVKDTYKIGDEICHLCQLDKGSIEESINNNFNTNIDTKRRQKIKLNHTATHLMHKALKNVLGAHVQQAGSLVSDNKLRFDLTHYEKLSKSQLNEVEQYVNDNIIKNTKLGIDNKKYDEAKKMGAEALFGEKYGDIVRVVSIGDFSVELCGGTHVDRTGDIGLFKIISESALSSGVRRIEAVTGMEAYQYANMNIEMIDSIKKKLQCNQEDVISKIDDLLEKSKMASGVMKELEINKIKDILASSEILMEDKSVVIYKTEISFSVDIKSFVDQFLNCYNKKTIFLVGMRSDKPMILLCASKDILNEFNAGLTVKEISKELGSGGGGPAHFGSSGFNDKNIYKNAYNLFTKHLKEIKIG